MINLVLSGKYNYAQYKPGCVFDVGGKGSAELWTGMRERKPPLRGWGSFQIPAGVLLNSERVVGEHGKPGAGQGGKGCALPRLRPRAHILERPLLGLSCELEVRRAGFDPRAGHAESSVLGLRSGSWSSSQSVGIASLPRLWTDSLAGRPGLGSPGTSPEGARAYLQ